MTKRSPTPLVAQAAAIDLPEGAEVPEWVHLLPAAQGEIQGDYGKALFNRADFQRLADVLAAIKGSFVLSINDVPEIREIFAWARIDEVKTTYTIGVQNDARGERAELIIRGGKL